MWLLLLPLTAGAQPLRAIHTHLSTNDGLCSNAISAIRQVDYGYIWIATWNGLSRYDGYEFYNYRMGSGSGVKHLHNRLLDIRIDQFQNVWMHMYDNRVFVLNRHTDKIINPFEGKVGFEEFRLGSKILTTSKGEVLLNIRDVGLYVAHLDPNDGLKSTLVDTHGMKIGCMAEGVDDDVWLGTTQGIYRGIRHTMALDTLSILTHEEVTALCVHSIPSMPPQNKVPSTGLPSPQKSSRSESPRERRCSTCSSTVTACCGSATTRWGPRI